MLKGLLPLFIIMCECLAAQAEAPDTARARGAFITGEFAADPWQKELANRIQAFFVKEGIGKHLSMYEIDGTPVRSARYQATGLVAMNAVASLAATHPRAGEFVQALWATPTPVGQWRYYDGMLYLLGLLHCAGEFRVWTPR